MRFSIFILISFISFNVSAQKTITIDDIWTNYTFSTSGVPGFNFMNDGKHYTRLESNAIERYDVETGKKVETILEGTSLKDQAAFGGKIGKYTFSKDETKILIESEISYVYRRSYYAFVHIYDRESKKLTAVYEEDKVMNAAFSPDASKVAYVWKNNLYYFDIAEEMTLPITFDGEKDKIINGAADWVYEEEFSITKSYEWSPNGDMIAYLRYDETEVPEYTMMYHNGNLYPEYYTFKYPKVGEQNAKVTTHIYDLSSDETKNVSQADGMEYTPRIQWTKKNNMLISTRMNRHQNHLKLVAIDVSNMSEKTLIEEKSKYYIDVHDNLTFLENGREFIWQSESSGFTHLYLYDINGKKKNAITKGDYDVTSYYGYNEDNKRVYYQAAAKNPMNREVYSIKKNGKSKQMYKSIDGTVRARFSPTFDYYTLIQSTANKAATYTVYNAKERKLRDLETNASLAKIQDAYGVAPVEFFDFKTENGDQLNGYMIKPSNMEEGKSYPLLMYVYGGPGSQTVNNSWIGNNYWWFQMLAQQGYVVASVDNRGTGARGEEFKKMTYLELGKYETEDQISAAKYLGSQDYIDADRIGIFGWSYGGYMSSLCILKGNEVFKAAIAVAPVTNWKWYDTIYTERYMRTESENESGYKDNSPVYFADRLEGAYLLVHGDADDNVHLQNSYEMTRELIKHNKQFDTYIYPNRNHGIYGANARRHLYTKMTNFLKEEL